MALYDPNEFPTETKVGSDFTLEDVLAWARTKPADEEYDYIGTYDGLTNLCAVERFLKETGRAARPMASSHEWTDLRKGGWRDQPPGVAAASISFPRTFGAFADRLEKALS